MAFPSSKYNCPASYRSTFGLSHSSFCTSWAAFGSQVAQQAAPEVALYPKCSRTKSQNVCLFQVPMEINLFCVETSVEIVM